MAFAETSVEKQAEADAARIKLNDFQAQLSQASDDYFAALDAHTAAVKGMEDAKARIAELQSHLGTRARAMYRKGNSSFLEVLFGSTSFEDFVSTFDTLNELNQQDATWVEQSKAAREEYSRQEKIAAEKLEESKKIKAEAEALVAEQDALVASLDAEVAALVAQENAAAMAAATVATSEQAAQESGVTGSRGDGDYSSVLDAAASRVGCAYVWGASGPDAFDCSGFVMWCYAHVGVYLSHGSGSQGFVGETYPVSQAQPGDILWKDGHVGIYAGGGTSIEAMDDANGVCYGNAYRYTHATHP